MTYLLTWKGSYHDIKVARYASKAAAKAVLDGIEDPSIGGVEVDIDIDLDYKKTELAMMFNALGSEPDFKGFKTKADGQRKVFAQIEDLGKSMPITDVSIPDTMTTPPSEAPPSEELTEGDTDMAAKKKTAKPRKAKTAKAPKVKVKAASNGAVKTKAPKVARAPRGENVTALITKMLERDRGASKKEIKAAALEKDPKYDEVKLDNTVRGILSVMSRNTPKFKKAKDDKRGLVYSIG